MLGLASCSSASDLPPLPQTQPGPYRLSVNDQIRVVTFGQDQLTGQFRVDDRGKIAIALLGAIQADGLTTAELERSIERELKAQQLLADPRVAVEIVGYRPIFILGEVTKPGEYAYQPGMTVLTAVALAGGFTYRARTDSAAILRATDHDALESKAPRSATVLPGDVITIQERIF
jgi:polysaccharide export outer membrane protein